MTWCLCWTAQVDSGRGGADTEGQGCPVLPEPPPAPHGEAHSRFWGWGGGQERQQPSSLNRAWSWANKGGAISAGAAPGNGAGTRSQAQTGVDCTQVGGWWPLQPCKADCTSPSHLRRRGWGAGSGLTAGQLSGAHAFFVVTTTSPSWCCSHSWVTQRFPGSGQVSPGCRAPQLVSDLPRDLQRRGALCLSVCPQPIASEGLPGLCQRQEHLPRDPSTPGSCPLSQHCGPSPWEGAGVEVGMGLAPWAPKGGCALPQPVRSPCLPSEGHASSPAATTHVEEVGRAVAGVHDAGHLHA